MRHLAVLFALVAILAVPAPAAKEAKHPVLVSFSGALKRVTKKEVVIEPNADNELTFIRTKKTSFISSGRKLSGEALPEGIAVTVQAFEKLNEELEAVTVTVVIPDQSPIK
jgi:hypothetical protein